MVELLLILFKDRLPFLDTGIVEILAKATNGLGIVLEHRYYGTTTPDKLLAIFINHDKANPSRFRTLALTPFGKNISLFCIK